DAKTTRSDRTKRSSDKKGRRSDVINSLSQIASRPFAILIMRRKQDVKRTRVRMTPATKRVEEIRTSKWQQQKARKSDHETEAANLWNMGSQAKIRTITTIRHGPHRNSP
ncbi:4830_t:CDS:1, partial [Acaulospora morrowiae]